MTGAPSEFHSNGIKPPLTPNSQDSDSFDSSWDTAPSPPKDLAAGTYASGRLRRSKSYIHLASYADLSDMSDADESTYLNGAKSNDSSYLTRARSNDYTRLGRARSNDIVGEPTGHLSSMSFNDAVISLAEKDRPRGLTKSYGCLDICRRQGNVVSASFKEKIRNAMAFVRTSVKSEKADRLKGKELDKVAIAKMRKGAEEYDEMLGAMEKEDAERKDQDDDESYFNFEEVDAREKLQITSLRRQLASMRKRS